MRKQKNVPDSCSAPPRRLTRSRLMFAKAVWVDPFPEIRQEGVKTADLSISKLRLRIPGWWAQHIACRPEEGVRTADFVDFGTSAPDPRLEGCQNCGTKKNVPDSCSAPPKVFNKLQNTSISTCAFTPGTHVPWKAETGSTSSLTHAPHRHATVC